MRRCRPLWHHTTILLASLRLINNPKLLLSGPISHISPVTEVVDLVRRFGTEDKDIVEHGMKAYFNLVEGCAANKARIGGAAAAGKPCYSTIVTDII